MHPTILDLTQWRPFGFDVGSFVGSNWPFLVVALALALGLGGIAQRRAAAGGRVFGALGLVFLLIAVAVMVALAIAFGRVHSYGLMMALGFMAGIAAARWRARRCGEDGEVVTTMGIVALVGGVVGARISYLVESYAKTGEAPGFFALTSGGLVFDGGLILATVLVLGYLLVRRLPVRRMLDIIAISAMIGLAFGRMGCLLNGCCHGGICRQDFPLAIHFPYASIPLVYPHEGENPYPPGAHTSAVYQRQFEQKYYAHAVGPEATRLLAEWSVPSFLIDRHSPSQPRLKPPGELTAVQEGSEFKAAAHARALGVQPAQVYGMLNALVLAGLLTAFFRLRKREGQVFALLFVLYPITRFVLEIIRDDNPGMALTPAQMKCLVMMGFGLAILLVLQKLPASAGPVGAARAPAGHAGPLPKGTPENARKRRKRK